LFSLPLGDLRVEGGDAGFLRIASGTQGAVVEEGKQLTLVNVITDFDGDLCDAAVALGGDIGLLLGDERARCVEVFRVGGVRGRDWGGRRMDSGGRRCCRGGDTRGLDLRMGVAPSAQENQGCNSGQPDLASIYAIHVFHQPIQFHRVSQIQRAGRRKRT